MTAAATHTLSYPISRTVNAGQAGERVEEITEVTLRRIKGKDMRAIGKISSDDEAGLVMIGRLSGLSAAEVDELDAADIEKLGKIIEGFTPPGRPTGERSSGT